MNFRDFNMVNISNDIVPYTMLSTTIIIFDRDLYNLRTHLQSMIGIYDSSGFYLQCK